MGCMPLKPVVTTILRHPDGLYAILNRRRSAFAPPDWKPGDKKPGLAADHDPYVEEIVPLAEVEPDRIYRREKLLRSWEALGRVDAWDAELLAHALHVLFRTIADPDTDVTDVPPLAVEQPAAPPRATAAHPRAYQGTKYKPPKPPARQPINLQPHICTLGSERQMLEQLRLHFDEAVALLEQWHPYGGVLREHGQECLQPFAQCWPAEHSKDAAALPAIFKRHLLGYIGAFAWEHVTALLAVYWSANLEHDGPLRRCIGHLLSIFPGPRMIDWARVVVQMPPARRTHFAELVIESEACRENADEQTVAGLLRADELIPDTEYRHRMFYALTCVAENAGLEYANDGFALARDFDTDWNFDAVGSGSGVAAAVRKFVTCTPSNDTWYKFTPMDLWGRCAKLEGLKELLESPDWQRIPPQSAHCLLSALTVIIYEELDEEELRDLWSVLREQAPRFIRFLEQIDAAYHEKMLAGFREALNWQWIGASTLRRAVEPFLELLAHVCRAPFQTQNAPAKALAGFATLPPAQLLAIAAAGDTSFEKLESAARRENDSWPIECGLSGLCEVLPALTTAAFERHPQQLLKAAHTLGVLDVDFRESLLREFAQHTLITTDIATLTPPQLVKLVQAHARSGTSNPVPRRLREHLSGQRTLHPKQIEHDVEGIRQQWLAFQFDVLNQLVFDRIAEGLPATERTRQVKHALLMHQHAGPHKRGLRQLLKVCFAGRRDYVEQHPANRQWLAAHPRVERDEWLAGVTRQAEVPELGLLELAVERDPLEVLRLGSYFGTCLGIGGGQTYSAAAIALDVNKQVVYARTAGGRVVARQLLAIAEDDRLVCFSVYPQSASRHVLAAFRDYDHQFAAALGLRIYEAPAEGESNTDGGEYEIATILAREFWDDDAWDFSLETGD